MRTSISSIGFALTLAFAAQAHAAEIDWTKVDAALGKTASVQGQVHRYGIPRSDLQVMLDGVAIKPALALGGWLGFEPMQDGALVMGDLVLTETEVNPVMSKLLESGIEITAVHNHLMRSTPATYYMHIHGHGDPAVMAAAIRAALGESETPDESVVRAYPRIEEAAAFRDSGAKRQWSSAVAHRLLRLDYLWQCAAESASSKSLFHSCSRC